MLELHYPMIQFLINIDIPLSVFRFSQIISENRGAYGNEVLLRPVFVFWKMPLSVYNKCPRRMSVRFGYFSRASFVCLFGFLAFFDANFGFEMFVLVLQLQSKINKT